MPDKVESGKRVGDELIFACSRCGAPSPEPLELSYGCDCFALAQRPDLRVMRKAQAAILAINFIWELYT